MDYCNLCLELFKELCHSLENPTLCKIYEDYATGVISGEAPLHYAIKVAGWNNFIKARKRLIERGILQDEK